MRAMMLGLVLFVACSDGNSTPRGPDAGGTGGMAGAAAVPGFDAAAGSDAGRPPGTGGSGAIGQTPTYQDRSVCPPCTRRSVLADGQQGYHSCRATGSAQSASDELFVRVCVILDSQGRQTAYCDSAGNYIPACWTNETPGTVGATFCRALPNGIASYSTHPDRLCPGISPPGASWSDGKERYCKPLKPNDVFVPAPTNCSDSVVVPNNPSGWFATEFYAVSCNGTDLPSTPSPSSYGLFYPVVDSCSEHGCRATTVYCK